MEIKSRYYCFTLLLGLFTLELNALPEMIIGESTMEPGINLIFEGGIKAVSYTHLRAHET